jgi:hypothetical protein
MRSGPRDGSVFVRAGATAGTGTRANPYGTIGQASPRRAAADGRLRRRRPYTENLDLGMQRRRMLVGGLNSAFTARNPVARRAPSRGRTPTRTSCTPKPRSNW